MFKDLNEWVDSLVKDRARAMVWLAAVLLLVLILSTGCSSLKSAAWVTGVSAATGAAASIVTGNPLPAIAAASLAGGATALVTTPTAAPLSAAEVNNPWAALAVWATTSTKWLIFGGLACILFGWLVPGPLKLNRRERDSSR